MREINVALPVGRRLAQRLLTVTSSQADDDPEKPTQDAAAEL